MKKLMIFGGSEAQSFAIKKAKEMGYQTLCVDMYSDAYCRDIADEFVQVSTLDYDKLKEIIIKHKPDGLMTIASDRPMPIIAKLADEFKFNAVSVKAAENSTNKLKMRNALNNKGVAIPKFAEIVTIDDLINNIQIINYPAILKPVDSSGSRGISLIKNESDLQNAFEYSSKYKNSTSMLLEEYMFGPEYSIESFVEDNKVTICAITEKYTTGAPHFVEMGHLIPARISDKQSREISNLVKDMAKALEIGNGPMHTEVIITSDGPKIVENGVRLGGDYITSDLVPLATGIDILAMTIQFALGEKIEKKQLLNKSAAIRFIKTIPGKVVNNIAFCNELNVHRIYIDKSKYCKAIDINNSADRMGYVICNANNNKDCLDSLDATMESMVVTYA